MPSNSADNAARSISARMFAFTLIELLAVIAITGILAGLLFPEISEVRAKSQATTCVSNLRQIGTAVLLYANDRGGELPPYMANSVLWMELLTNAGYLAPQNHPTAASAGATEFGLAQPAVRIMARMAAMVRCKLCCRIPPQQMCSAKSVRQDFFKLRIHPGLG